MPDYDRHGVARQWMRGFAGMVRLPIYRSSYALILTTGANALLGLLFWVAAARLYPPDVVGLGAGGISALQLVASVGWVGLQFTLMRYVPVAGLRRRRLVALTYATGMGAALVGAVVFTTGFARTLGVSYLAHGALSTGAFWIAVAVWVMFSLQDAVLLGIRRTFLVPVENAVYGLVKLILLIGLSSVDDPWTFLGAWVGGTGVLVVAINGLLFHRMLSEDRSRSRLPSGLRIARFSAGHTVVAVTGWLPDLLVPLLVLRYLNHAANAYYYAAWTVGFSTRLLATNIANAMTVEGAYVEGAVRVLLRPVIHLCLTIVLPVMGVLLLAAPLILEVFGPRYADAAAPLLRLFAISLVPYTVATLVVAFDRLRERFGAALAITGVGTVTTIGLDLILIPADGISGAGVAWLCGQAAAAVVAVAAAMRAGRQARGVPATQSA